ncbi:MAG: hypothetical protein ACP5XB_27105 [Isosphaeraceae bacterium]
MKRPRILTIEPLEEKALLSSLALPVLQASPPIPAPATQGLVVKLTTDHRVYRAGQPVVMTLTETNTSQNPINIVEGPSTSGFLAARAGRKVWASNAGIQPMFVMSQTLQPGQSITLSTTWNGQSQVGRRGPVLGRVAISTQIPGAPHVNIVILRS